MIALSVSAAALAAAALAIDLTRARQRLSRWPTLAASDASPAADVRFLTADGIALDEQVKRAAAAHLAAHGLDAVDLVPATLDVAAALEIASVADPAALTADPFARTAGGGYAIAVRESLLARAGLPRSTDAPSIAGAAERLRRYAVTRTGITIAPGLPSVRERASERAAMLRARTGTGFGPRIYVDGIRWVLLVVALAADLRIGLVLLLAWSMAPSLVFTGLPLQPRDRWSSLLTRIPHDLLAWIRACLQPDPRAAAIEARRSEYARLIADGTAPFFAPRRERCPLCGHANVRPHVATTDLVQRKPGRFVLDRCGACGLVFQNPALSSRGLDYYYRDFYDGLNGDGMDEVFAATHALYTSRIATVLATGGQPARWIDLGCGYGHFALAARRQLAGTRFEGLDRSSSVEEATRRGWLDRAWRMRTDELVATGERFDLVSLFHYLEHTPDPALEIRMAAQLLAPNGRLAIEIPNPRCRLGNILGRWWFPWFQPQHQLLLDESAVRTLLADAGLAPIAVSYLMTAGDVLLSTLLFVRRACSAGDVPWEPSPPGLGRRLADAAIWAAALPLLIGAVLADAIYNALPPSATTSNALRVVATRSMSSAARPTPPAAASAR